MKREKSKERKKQKREGLETRFMVNDPGVAQVISGGVIFVC
jgi:hypothetical protein